MGGISKATEARGIAVTLSSVGFTDFEIKEFINAKTPDGKPQPLPDLSDPAWKRAMVERLEDRGRVGAMLRRKTGKKPQRRIIEEVFNQRYRSTEDLKPWDYVQAESLKGAKKRNIMDYDKTARAIRQLRAQTKVSVIRRREVKKVLPRVARQLSIEAA